MLHRLAIALLVAAALAAPASADTLSAIKARGAIVIGYREGAAPFSDAGPNGQPQGYSIDLCNAIANSVKTTLNDDKLAVRYEPVTAANRIDKLVKGDIDIECGITTRTLSRQEKVDFTLFTFLTGTELLVKVTSDIHGTPDLAGKKIAVQPGTTTETEMKRLLELRLVNAEFVPVQTPDDGLDAVENGKADAFASDEIVLIGLIAKAPANLRLSGTLYSYEPYAFMVRKDDSKFRLIADRTLALIYQGDDITAIYRKWFGGQSQDPPPLLQAMYAIQSLQP